MIIQCRWTEKMKFAVDADGHTIMMDTKSPIGSDSALSPKQLLLAAVSGCTGMDVVALLRKFKQTPETLQIQADADLSDGGYPVIFKEIHLAFTLKGSLDAEKVLEAVQLSQSKYCGVSAMVAKAVPISYTIDLNGEIIGTGRANFN